MTGPFDAAVFRDLERRVREYILSGNMNEEALDYPETYASVIAEIRGNPNDPMVRWAVQQVVKGRIQVTIKPRPSQGIGVISGISGVAKVPNSAELAANVDATLTYSTKRLFDAKLPRMAKVTGYHRKVLLIWSGIPFADAADVSRHTTAQSATDIDGIFFVELGRERVTLILDAGLHLGAPDQLQ